MLLRGEYNVILRFVLNVFSQTGLLLVYLLFALVGEGRNLFDLK